MNSSPWQQSYNQQPYLGGGGGGSPLLPTSTHEDTLNNFANTFLPSQDLQSSLSNADPAALLSSYESLLSPKETPKFYGDGVFNGVCKDQNFLHCSSEQRNKGSFGGSDTGYAVQLPACSEPRDEGGFAGSDAGYSGQLPSIGFNSSSGGADPSPFGVLPHLAVKPAVSRAHENFVSPVSSAVAAYSNGPYAERDSSGVPPNSVSSSFSADTATPSPAALNSISSNFSSPSTNEYTFSPQTMGAYNKPVHSPCMPPSPSMTHPSYPSSPYTNIDSHIPAERSPMNSGAYVNNLNAVPVRNGLHKQSKNGVVPNSVCYAPQSHIPGLSKTPDYHPDYNVYHPDRISPSSYSSGYSSMHSSRMSNDSRMSLSPRGNSGLPHEMRYGHLRSVPSATVSSPTYLPSSVGCHDIQYAPSNMQPPSYMPCPPPMNAHSYAGPSTVVSNNSMVSEDPYAFPSSDMVDDKSALELFNCPAARTPAPFLGYGGGDVHSASCDPNRMSRSSNGNERSVHYAAGANKSLVQQPPILYNNKPMKADVQSAIPNYYNPMSQMGHSMFDAPKRRGRGRGRRRGGNVGCRGRGRRGQSWRNDDRNVYYYDASYSRTNEYNAYHQQFKREPDPTPFTNVPNMTTRVISVSDVNIANSNSALRGTVQRFVHPYGMIQIRHEINGLVISFQSRRRRLRSCTRRETKFVIDFLCFLRGRKIPKPGTVWPPRLCAKKMQAIKDATTAKTKVKRQHNYSELKIKIQVVDPKKRDKWRCMRGTSDSPVTLTSDDEEEEEVNVGASTSTASDHVLLSSHEIKREVESDEEESLAQYETGNFCRVTGKCSAKTKHNCKSVDERRRHLNVTNSETLPAGKGRVRPESAIYPAEKKFGKRTKLSEDTDLNMLSGSSALNGPGPASNSSVFRSDEANSSEERPRPLRSSSSNSLKEPKPGPSSQEDLGDVSDHFDHFDDSDSDPAWTPASKSTRAADAAKSFSGPSRKRGQKSRKTSTTSTPAKKKRTSSQETQPKKKRQSKPKPAPVIPKASETRSRGRKDTGTDRFLIAKADINQPTPFIWKVDRKSSMLQRFEVSEQNGVLLYHSSFTYAAGNQFCVSNYVTADVKLLSPDTVQYLGPNLSETAEMALSEMAQAGAQEGSFDHLKEDFTVYIQSLLSQDVDSSFLQEIKKFNDEYFLVPIQNLEAISESKKEKLSNEFWNEELKKSINAYPHVNILDSAIDSIKCQACERVQGNKLLQFFGQAYNPLTLEHMDLLPPPAKTQFSVCDNCSTSVSMYSRLHHLKYNLFVDCHSKASEVKANNDNVQSHEDVLKICLEDTVWIEKNLRRAGSNLERVREGQLTRSLHPPTPHSKGLL